jgi:hypothetical protein
MNKTFFEMLLDKSDDIEPFLKRQRSAATIALMGPTSSAKSTLITALLPPESNKLLSRNIGDTAQTTLIPTRLMLNSNFNENEILVTVKKKSERSCFPFFWESLAEALTDEIYERRDEWEELHGPKEAHAEFGPEIVKRVLDPINRAFHVFNFADNKNLTAELLQIMEKMAEYIVWETGLIKDEAEKLFRELRKTKSTAKKREAYEQIVESRMGKMSNGDLTIWYDKLESAILESLSNFWVGAREQRQKRIFIANLHPDATFEDKYPDFLYDWGNAETADELIGLLYAKDSPYSLVFDEIMYATRPSESFIAVFGKDYPDRTVKINVLDTVGLTQSSQVAEDISLNMDDIISRESDALMFLCAADEQPLVYATCIKLLKEKNLQLKQKIVVVCRTKADIVIRNIMRNAWKRDNGTNKIDKGLYEKYVTEARGTFVADLITEPKEGENKLGFESGSKIEFISLTPDSAEDMGKYLGGDLDEGKAFDILFDIVKRVDKMYKRDEDLWLTSKNPTLEPMQVAFSGEHLTKTIAMALVTSNSRNGNQYTQYIKDKNIRYHGRSVNCFRIKLANGYGHETNAGYYGNFRLFITAMVNRWLKEVIPPELLGDFTVDFNNLETAMTDERRAKLVKDFLWALNNNWDMLLLHCAQALSYIFLKKDFEACYSKGDSWSDAFRNSLEVMSGKFSDENYWEKCLAVCFSTFSNNMLRKLYIFD